MATTRRRSKLTARLHKASGQAVIYFRGKTIYLGKFGSPEAAAALAHYNAQLVLADGDTGRMLDASVTVAQVVCAYLDHLETKGRSDHHIRECQRACETMVAMFGSLRASDFRARHMAMVREAMLAESAKRERERDRGARARKLSRQTINSRFYKARSAFKVAAAIGLIDEDVVARLKVAEGVDRGDKRVRRTEPKARISRAQVEATLAKLPPAVGDVVRLQLHTGARPTEILTMRPIEIDRSGPVWIFTPANHKSAHLEIDRHIFIGEEGQQILERHLSRSLAVAAPIFTQGMIADDTKRRYRAIATTPRRHEVSAEGDPRIKYPERAWTVEKYRDAVNRACARAGVERWNPHQLRHLRIDEWARTLGIDAARMLAGHTSNRMTEHYTDQMGAMLRIAAQALSA